MILDGLLQLSSAQSLIGAAGNVDSSNILDFGINNGIPSSPNGGGARDMGVGNPPLKLLVSAATAIAAGAGVTVIVQVQFAPDNGVGAPGAFTVAESSAPIPVTQFAAGARLFQGDMPRPQAGQSLPRYMKLTYVLSGAVTAGSVQAYVVLDRSDRPEGPTGALSGYAENISIPN